MSRNLTITKLEIELEALQNSKCIGIDRPNDTIHFHLQNGKVYKESADGWEIVDRRESGLILYLVNFLFKSLIKHK